jgi:hypothetical protein
VEFFRARSIIRSNQSQLELDGLICPYAIWGKVKDNFYCLNCNHYLKNAIFHSKGICLRETAFILWHGALSNKIMKIHTVRLILGAVK